MQFANMVTWFLGSSILDSRLLHLRFFIGSPNVSLLSDRLSAHVYKRENGVTNEAIVNEWAAAAAW